MKKAASTVEAYAKEASEKVSEAVDNLKANENVKKVTDKLTDTYEKAAKGVNDYLSKPEVQEGIEHAKDVTIDVAEKAKDVTIDVAEKAVAALKKWLKPEDKENSDKE